MKDHKKSAKKKHQVAKDEVAKVSQEMPGTACPQSRQPSFATRGFCFVCEVAAVPRKGKGMEEILGEERIDATIKKIEAEKEEEAAGTAGAMRTD